MPLYICNWKDGTSTIVWARDKDDAVDLLDELGGADVSMIKRFNHLMITLKVVRPADLHDDIEFELIDNQTGARTVNELFDKMVAACDLRNEQLEADIDECILAD